MKFPSRKIEMGVAPLALLSAAFIVLVYNRLFWSSLFQCIDIGSVQGMLLAGNVFIIVTGAATVFFLCFGIKHIFRPFLMAILVLSSFISYFEGHYGVVIDKTMVQNILETDYRETAELASLSLYFHVGLFGFLPAFGLTFVKVQFNPFAREFSLRLLSFVLAIVVIGVFSLAGYKDITLIGRNHAELRMFLNPSYALYSAVTYLRHRNHKAGIAPIATDARQVKPAQERKKTVVILVVGETARASQFSLNGYERKTSQYLEKDNVISFTQTYACGTSTAYSLPCMFSHLGRSGYSPEKAAGYENVLDVLARAGVSVLWRDNNSGCKGICTRVVMEDMAREGMKDVPDLCKSGECFDEVLLYKLEDRIRQTDSDVLIVLHQKGSHGPAYSKRHPESFSRFLPECTSNTPQDCENSLIVNAYDNTISYTDYVLHRTIALLKQEAGINTLLMYFSDHGESLGENGIFLHGLPYMIAPDEQKHIPFVLWMSDGFAGSRGIDRNCLSGKRDQPYSHDNIFHSLLGSFRVQTELYRQEQDILTQCRNDPGWQGNFPHRDPDIEVAKKQ